MCTTTSTYCLVLVYLVGVSFKTSSALFQQINYKSQKPSIQRYLLLVSLIKKITHILLERTKSLLKSLEKILYHVYIKTTFLLGTFFLYRLNKCLNVSEKTLSRMWVFILRSFKKTVNFFTYVQSKVQLIKDKKFSIKPLSGYYMYKYISINSIQYIVKVAT